MTGFNVSREVSATEFFMECGSYLFSITLQRKLAYQSCAFGHVCIV